MCQHTPSTDDTVVTTRPAPRPSALGEGVCQTLIRKSHKYSITNYGLCKGSENMSQSGLMAECAPKLSARGPGPGSQRAWRLPAQASGERYHAMRVACSCGLWRGSHAAPGGHPSPAFSPLAHCLRPSSAPPLPPSILHLPWPLN